MLVGSSLAHATYSASNDYLTVGFGEKYSSGSTAGGWYFDKTGTPGVLGIYCCYLEHFAVWMQGRIWESENDFGVAQTFADSPDGRTAILVAGDIQVERKIYVPPGHNPYFLMTYTIKNVGATPLTDVRFFENIDLDIGDPSGDYGWYSPVSDSVWQEDTRYYKNGFYGDRPSSGHGMEHWSWQNYSDWDDGVLNGLDRYPATGTTDVSVGQQWTVGAPGDPLDPGEEWRIVITWAFGEEPGGTIMADAGPAQTVAAGRTVYFDGTGSSCSGTACPIAGYDWDLDGDGFYDDASGPYASYVYGSPGDYSVGLRVTGHDGSTATDRTVVHVVAGDFVNLEIEKWTTHWASPGDTLIYGIRYRNNGTLPAANVRIVDTLPANVDYVGSTGGWASYNPATRQVTFDLGTVPPGGYQYLGFTVQVNWGLSSGTILHNCVQITTTSTESNYGDNDSFWDTTIRVAHDPNQKSVSPTGDVQPGDLLTYTVEYQNEGAGTAYGVYVTDQLDEDLDAATLNVGGGGTYDPATRTITWYVGEVGPGAGGSFTFSAKVRGDAPPGTVISNFATVVFPSVPEVTRTNLVTNAIPLRLVVPGDLDADGDVDSGDLQIFRRTFGKCEGAVGYLDAADYDGDNCITFVDYQTWYRYYRNYRARP